jgi:HEAT repeat protein
MSIWRRIFGFAQKKAWLLSCPLCKTKYRLGVDAYLVTPEDVRTFAAGAGTTVGNLNNVLFSADGVYSIGNPSQSDQPLLQETARKVREIANAIAIGQRRVWFCRKCGGPDKGENPYPPQVAESPEIARLTRLLVSDNTTARWEAASALRKMKDPRVLGPLIAALGDDWAGYDAQQAIVESNDARVVDPLSRVLADRGYPRRHRKAVAQTLGKLKRDEVVAPLTRALADEEESVRLGAAMALAESGWGGVLIKCLTNPDPRVREAAAGAVWLKKGGLPRDPDALNDYRADASVIEPLIASLGDPHPQVRRRAAASLGSCRNSAAVAALVAVLNDTDSLLRDAAIEALGKIGDKTATMPLISALANPDHWVRREACAALAKLGDARAVDPLIAALQDDSTKRAAAQALADLGDQRGLAEISKQGIEVTDSKTANAQRLAKIQGAIWAGDVGKLRDIIVDDMYGVDEDDTTTH